MKKVVIFLGILFVMRVGVSKATVIHVPADQPTIQAGINAANYGDTVLVAPGTYYENDTLKARITLVSEKGADSTVIDGDSTYYPVLRCDSCDFLTIMGFTMKNGECYGYYPTLYKGGGLNCTGCDFLQLRDNKIMDNECPLTCVGGGVGAFIIGDSVIIMDNVFSDNILEPYECGGGIGGAGLHITGKDCLIEANTFYNNRNYGDGGSPGGAVVCKGSYSRVRGNYFVNNLVRLNYRVGGGGGIFIDSKNSVVDSNMFQGNIVDSYVSPAFGGAIFVISDSCVVRNNQFQENIAQSYSGPANGGAIYSQGLNNEIVGNTIIRNKISCTYNENEGAGIFSSGQSATIADNLIAYNTIDAKYGARAKGAGLYVSGDSSVVFNNSFYRNQALGQAGGPPSNWTMYAQGGGIFCSATEAHVTNNIFTNNRTDGFCGDTSMCLSGYDCVDGSLCVPNSVGGGAITCSTSVVLDCNNFYENYANGILNHINGASYGLNDFSADPLFCLPESSDFHLLENSPCLNVTNCGLVGALSSGCTACVAKAGDANGTLPISLPDVIHLVNYVFDKDRPATSCLSSDPDNCWTPDPPCRGEVDGLSPIGLTDVIYLVNYVFDKDRLSNNCYGADAGNCWTPVSTGICCLPIP